MKYLIYLAFIGLLTNSALGQINTPQQWNMTVRVSDEDGNPIGDANVGVGYYNGGPQGINGVTDTNGIYAASHPSTPGLMANLLSFRVVKNGYYPTWNEIDLGPGYNPDKWNQTVILTLQKIINPIAMYARRAQMEIPIVDKAIGFDLIKADWVAPYGKGEQSDILFETHRRWVNRRNFDSTLRVAFPNPGDGLLPASNSSVQGSSGPPIPTTAPLEGYTGGLLRELSNTPTGGWKDNSQNQNYYLRVHTVLDENGNVKSALYGKIYGDFTLDPINSKTTWIIFTYYLNPTPNDRNVEFDPSRNLFRNLPAMQQVKEP